MRYQGPNREGYERDIRIIADALLTDPGFRESGTSALDEAYDAARQVADDYHVYNDSDVFADLHETVTRMGYERSR